MDNKETLFGRIFRRYIRPTKKGDKINIPIYLGKDPDGYFANVIMSVGETVDLISALNDVLNSMGKEVYFK